jgi:hypothetical protein
VSSDASCTKGDGEQDTQAPMVVQQEKTTAPARQSTALKQEGPGTAYQRLCRPHGTAREVQLQLNNATTEELGLPPGQALLSSGKEHPAADVNHVSREGLAACISSMQTNT